MYVWKRLGFSCVQALLQQPSGHRPHWGLASDAFEASLTGVIDGTKSQLTVRPG